jgi:formylglycine-generating enzyme required for sulfatase activity
VSAVHTIIDMTTRSSNIYEFKSKYLSYTWEDWEYVLELLTYYTGIEFSFPTEAQWEFAARGGNLSKGYLYPGSNKWEEVYADDLNSIDDTVPNELGLYNMANRRGEWCADAYASYIDGPMPTNPLITEGDGHVVRGGCHISTGLYKNWLSTTLTTVFDYSDTCEDWRMSRSTARAKHKRKSWDIGCRPVINIK